MYPQSMFGAKIRKKNQTFSYENLEFLQLKKILYFTLTRFRNDKGKLPIGCNILLHESFMRINYPPFLNVRTS